MALSYFAATYLSILLKVNFQWLDKVVKAECVHGKQDVLSIDGLSLLLVTPLARSG